MTLIACISPDTHPVILADALLSSPQTNRIVASPMLGTAPSDHSRFGYQPVALGTKVFAINDSIIAAYAGNPHLAKVIISGIADYFSSIPASLEWVGRYLDANHVADFSSGDVSLLLSVRDEKGEIRTWANSCRDYLVPRSERVFSDGTGRSRFEYFVSAFSAFATTGNALERNVEKAFLLKAALLADEFWTGVPYQYSFGGLYDIATFVSGRAAIIDDYTLVYWIGEEQGKAVSVDFPFKVLHRYCVCGVPYTHVFDIEWSRDAQKIRDERLFASDDLLGRWTYTTPHKPQPLLSKWQIHFILIKGERTGAVIGAFLSRRSDPKNHPIVFEGGGKTIKMSVSLKEIASMFRSFPHA